MDQPVTYPPDPTYGTGAPPPPPATAGQQPPAGGYDPYAPPQPYTSQPYGPPAPPEPYAQGSPGGPAHGPNRPGGPGPRTGLRGWHLAAAAVVALVVGLGVGIGAGGGDDGNVAALEAEVDELWDEIQSRDGELASLDAALEQAEQDLAAAEADAQAARDELAAGGGETAAPAQSEEPAETAPAPADGEYSAGSYTFADVQVSEDFIGDFEVRTRMTNTGQARDSVAITATLFSGGSVVGTATGIATDVASDATITMEMLSTDEYTAWDEVEFQVDFEL